MKPAVAKPAMPPTSLMLSTRALSIVVGPDQE
ncbi:hypothetical protein FHU13_005418 [Methylobacterium sp. R2-1]|nr:hypothetical protein [Methylobacterium sp. R2-1]